MDEEWCFPQLSRAVEEAVVWPGIGMGQAVFRLELEALLILVGERGCVCGTGSDLQMRGLRAH